MNKAKEFKVEDSNVEGIGSQENRDLRKQAAETEEAWKGAGQKDGQVDIWRIEKFKVVRWDKKNYGKFFDGDAYIILNTYCSPQNKSKLMYNVHFWLGKDCSQDEAGTAAYKTVELDDLFGDAPVQYREVQGYESDLFLKIFKGQITIMSGGVESGFKHHEPEKFVPKLMQFKGKKNVRLTEVPCKRESLNNGDVFLLDTGTKAFQWNGNNASIGEKRKCMSYINDLKEERLGRLKSLVLDGQEEDDEFWPLLGGMGDIAGPVPDEVVKKFDKAMFAVSDADGSLDMDPVEYKKENLRDDDVMVVDNGEAIFLYVGKGANASEKGSAMKYATDYLTKQGRPMHTPCIRVLQGAETAAFNRCF